MKPNQRKALLVFVSLLILGALQAFSGKVIGISDGDTISVLHDGKPEKIRLYGIGRPEKNQPFGTKSRQFTAGMVPRNPRRRN